MKGTSIKKILILVTILAVPGFLYYLLTEKGKNRYKPLPYFGPKAVASTFHSVRGKQIPDTVYHEIADFKLINQNSDTLNWKSFENKILILNLFYSNDNPGTKLANKVIKDFEKQYGKNTVIRFVSVSIDPKRDRPEVLSKYAAQLNAKAGKWDLLTGDSTQVYNLANKQLLVDALQKTDNGKTGFIYNNLFLLIDPQHHIRGYYEAANQEALAKLDDEIKVLIVEELRNNKDGR
ncbi:SCO family protein [Pedobacter nutrimenti]|jgi:protein SCO1/2|uniref:Protein SCO1/2 n=1 Tax=Pedobacter nutrimenti TaxID=1241337 RepID=A0A318UPR0_9SPHI|nr:SCO family protein [Pedobacter nutrimenti]PYF76085.1 protein SCO1/2 [Pedobacter nutrimenti]